MNKISSFFNKLIDETYHRLSHVPVFYSVLGGILVVLFWRGVWHTADILMAHGGFLGWIFYEPIQLVITLIGLLLTGLMVSVFIGDRVILSGLHHEKRVEEVTEELIKEEVVSLLSLRNEIRAVKKDIEELKNPQK